MSQIDLNDIPNVKIDPSGRFKYILIKLKIDENNTKYVVRGFAWAEFHADILDDFEKLYANKGIEIECLGGGRILHEPEKKHILVYGYSLGFGRADHQTAVDLVKKEYSDYTSIEFSNEGY